MLESFNTFLRKAYNLSNPGGHMTARRSVLLIIVLVFVAASCGDGGPGLLNPGNDWLVKFKRVTLATKFLGPDRLEIEIVVPHRNELFRTRARRHQGGRRNVDQ